MVKQYTATVRPMHIKYVEPMQAHAHIVLPENEPNETADALLLSFVRQRVDSVMASYAETIASDRRRWEASSDANLTDTQMLQVIAAFRAGDLDGSGSLSLTELRCAPARPAHACTHPRADTRANTRARTRLHAPTHARTPARPHACPHAHSCRAPHARHPPACLPACSELRL